MMTGEAPISREAVERVAKALLEEEIGRQGKRVALREATRNLRGFVDGYCWARNEQTGEEVDAREWPGQIKLREALETSKRVVGLKARGVGWTWELAWYALWILAQRNRQVLYLCQRQDNAFQFVRRVKWARSKLAERCVYPEMSADGDAAKHMRLTNGSEIVALPRDPDAIHFYHPALIIADEWARIGASVLAAVTGATGFDGQIVGVSTARGAVGEFYQVYRDAKASGAEPGFTAVFSPWMDCPLYPARPDAGSAKDTAQEYPEVEEEAFIETAPGEAVYPEFRAHIHIASQPLGYYRDAPIIRGWDFGGRQACIFTQLTRDGHWRWLRQIQEANIATSKMAEVVLRASTLWFPEASNFMDIGDPSGVVKKETDARSNFDLLLEKGIRVKPGAMMFNTRRDALSRWLTRLVDGRPAVQVDKSCDLLIKAMKGMYRFPDRPLETTKPVKDMWSDGPNCVEYIASVLEGVARRGTVARAAEARRPRYASAVTGY